MATIDMSVKLAAPADEVWGLVGDFANIHKWHPAVETSGAVGDGTVRRLASANGGPSFEEMEIERDEAGRKSRYAILGKPFPLENYSSWIAVSEDGTGSVLRWSAAFQPDEGREGKATGIIEFIYKTGIEALTERFGKG